MAAGTASSSAIATITVLTKKNTRRMVGDSEVKGLAQRLDPCSVVVHFVLFLGRRCRCGLARYAGRCGGFAERGCVHLLRRGHFRGRGAQTLRLLSLLTDHSENHIASEADVTSAQPVFRHVLGRLEKDRVPHIPKQREEVVVYEAKALQFRRECV